MLRAEPGTLLLKANSSLVSGLTAVGFDILLLGFLKAVAQMFCSLVNIYLIYDKRQSVAPVSSRLGAIWGSPVGQFKVVRWLSLLIACATASVFVIGFAIEGKTVPDYTLETYRSFVHITNKPTEISYESEFKETKNENGETEKMVSRRLLGMSYVYHCLGNNYSHFNIHNYAYRKTFLDNSLVNIRSRLDGAECVKDENFMENRLSRSHAVSSILIDMKCDIGTIPIVPSQDMRLVRVEVTPKSCGMKLTHLQCFGDSTFSCVGVAFGVGQLENVLFAVKIANHKNPSRIHALPVVDGKHLSDDRKRDHLASNAAFLLRAGFEGSINHLVLISFAEVLYDVALHKRLPDVQATEISLPLALPMVCVALGSTLLLCLTVGFLWIQIVYSKNRQHYNDFSTVPKALEIIGTSKPSKLHRRKVQKRWVGIREDFPAISEGKQNFVSGSEWKESELP